MTPSKEQNAPSVNPNYQEAEKMINQTIAKMDIETHIEYDSTMERKDTPSIFSKWLQWLRKSRK